MSAVELSAAVALLVMPVAVSDAVSPTFAFDHCFLSCSVADLRVFVYVHTIGPSPGFTVSVEPDSPVVPVQTGPVDV